MSQTPPLRRAALRGGLYLVGRQGVSIALKFVGVMLITRVLGPANYGAYVSGSNIYQYAATIGYAGVGIYILRSEGEVAEVSYRTAYSMLMMTGVPILVAIELAANTLSRWIGVAGFEGVIRILVFALPFQLLAMPASVRLERELDYKRVAMLEISGQLAFYIVAVPLVAMKFGPKALAAAWVLQWFITCVIAHVATGTLPRFAFDRAVARAILHYAAKYAVANWIWQLRMLVNPLVVGPALGARAVGIVGMTIGILDMLSVIKTIAWRLSVAILTKVVSDVQKLRDAVTQGMELQVLAVGTILLGFAWTGRFIIPHLFGQRWISVMEIYPYVAVSYLTIAMFNIHSATLSVINRNLGLAVYHVISVSIFGISAYFTVGKFGMVGYGYAELTTIPAYYVMHLVLARAIGSPDYRLSALWWLGVVAGLFSWMTPWLIIAPFVFLAMPLSIQKLKQTTNLVRR